MTMIKYFREMGEVEIQVRTPLVQKLKEGEVRRVWYPAEAIDLALSRANEMEWLLIKIAFDSGLRLSELRNLKVDSFTGRQIKFIGKGSKPRESYISEEAYAQLCEWIRKRGVTGYLWISYSGKHYSCGHLRVVMKRAFARVGIEDFYPHALRHSFGTDIQRKGASLLEMQQMLGHSNATTTQRYIHAMDGQLENIFMKYR